MINNETSSKTNEFIASTIIGLKDFLDLGYALSHHYFTLSNINHT